MRRTLTLATAASGLFLSAGVVPLLGTASAAACPTWTDAPNDAGIQSNGTMAKKDDTIDITAVKVEQTSTDLIATFTVPKLDDVNENTSGDRFQVTFTAGDTALRVYSDRDDLDLFPSSGVAKGNTTYPGGTAKYDVAGKKVVLTMPYTVLTTALGKPFAGNPLKAFGASVLAQVSATATAPAPAGKVGASTAPLVMETAPAPDGVTATGGVVCGSGGGGPVVAPPPPPGPPAPPAGSMPTDLPKAGCFTLTDAKDDAKLPAQNPDSDPDLDIINATFRTTPGWFMTYIRVNKLGTNPAYADGHRFGVDFSYNKHVFTLAASSYRNAQSATVRSTLAGTGIAGGMVQLSVDPATDDVGFVLQTVQPPFVASGAKAVFDTKNSMVILAVPNADLEKYGKAPFLGATVEAINVEAQSDYYRNSLVVDTTAPNNSGTGTAKWTSGDNKCFTVPTKLALSVAKKGSLRTVTAKLTTTAGQAVPAKPITFYLNGKKGPTLRTAANGTAVLKNVKAGVTVKAVFLSASGYVGSTASKRV